MKKKKIKSILAEYLEQIDKQINIMQSYLELRKSIGDLHGIMDSACDERELHAKKSILKNFVETLLSE